MGRGILAATTLAAAACLGLQGTDAFTGTVAAGRGGGSSSTALSDARPGPRMQKKVMVELPSYVEGEDSGPALRRKIIPHSSLDFIDPWRKPPEDGHEIDEFSKVWTNDDGEEIYYTMAPGINSPTVMYLPAFDTRPDDTKGERIKESCRAHDRTFLTADWYGCGRSSGDIKLGTITRWKEDTIKMLENVCPSARAVLVGGGVGGWVGLLVMLERPDLVAGFCGLSADPDFTEKLLWKYLPADKKKEIMDNGHSEVLWGNKYQIITRALIEDGRNNLLLDGPDKELSVPRPMRLVHGLNDEEVPYTVAIDIAKRVACPDLAVTLISGGHHHLDDSTRVRDIAVENIEYVCRQYQRISVIRDTIP